MNSLTVTPTSPSKAGPGLDPGIAELAVHFCLTHAPAVSGEQGHNTLYALACRLRLELGLSEDQAFGMLEKYYNPRCKPPWTDEELWHKVSSVREGGQPQPGLPKPAFQPERLECLAAQAPQVDETWYLERSPVNPAGIGPAEFLECVFRAGEQTLLLDRPDSSGQPVQVPLAPNARGILNHYQQGLEAGAFFLLNGHNGNPAPGTYGQLSLRTEKSIGSYRYILLESDEAPSDLWLRALAQFDLPIRAVTTSGGKSIHALWQVDAIDRGGWEAALSRHRVELVQLGVDPNALRPVQLSRLPFCERGEKGAMQRLLYLSDEVKPQSLRKVLGIQ